MVLGIRADFYARCAEYPELVGLVQDHQVLVGPMSLAESREAIEGPAARAGLRDLVKHLSIDPVKVHVVPLGVDPERFHPVPFRDGEGR